jgi:hypothetical protein
MTRIRGAGLVVLLLSLPLLSAVPAHADTPCATSQGYRFIATDGGVFSYGAADFRGSASGVIPTAAVGVASTPTGDGYWIATSDGRIVVYGDAVDHGSLTGVKLVKPIVGIAAKPTGDG